MEEIFITNDRNLKLSCVLHKPQTVGVYPAVILLHGFSGYKDEKHISTLAEDLVTNGFVAIRFDASGFAESEGDLEHDYRVTNYLSDIEVVYKYLASLDCVDTQRIGVWGQSLGGSLAVIFTAKHSEVKAVCSVSPITSVVRADREDRMQVWRSTGYFDKQSSRWGMLRFPYAFAKDASKWNALDYAMKVFAPLLMIVGTSDINVPISNSKEIFDLIPSKKEWFVVSGMDHFYKKDPNVLSLVNAKVVEFFKKII